MTAVLEEAHPAVLTSQETADYLRLPEPVLLEAARRGAMRGLHLAGYWRFRWADIQAMFDSAVQATAQIMALDAPPLLAAPAVSATSQKEGKRTEPAARVVTTRPPGEFLETLTKIGAYIHRSPATVLVLLRTKTFSGAVCFLDPCDPQKRRRYLVPRAELDAFNDLYNPAETRPTRPASAKVVKMKQRPDSQPPSTGFDALEIAGEEAACNFLGIGKETLRRLILAGDVHSYRRAGMTCFSRLELEQLRAQFSSDDHDESAVS
jgi:hypothetical protein